MMECLNHTLKAMLQKHVAKLGSQWDRYLAGGLWAYHNTPYEATREKLSFLLFGMDLQSSTEAALFPTTHIEPADLEDYWEEVILSLSSAHDLAACNI